MNDIDLPYVRQILLNDLTAFQRPDKQYLNRISRILPDATYLGFGRLYDATWYLLVESKLFPYHVLEFNLRPAIPVTGLSSYLASYQDAK